MPDFLLSKMQLNIWNHSRNRVLPLSESSDFQRLVADSISLWINNCPSDPAAVAYCAHPVTHELLILESTYDLFSVVIDTDGKPVVKKVCHLNNTNRKPSELNQRKTYRMLAFKRFIGLLLEDDELLVFETYKGTLIWGTDALKSERPKIWTSQGAIPRVGVWSSSAVRMIRSESVVKQAESMLKLSTKKPQEAPRERKVSKEYTLQLTLNEGKTKTGNVEHYVVVDHEDQQQKDIGLTSSNSSGRPGQYLDQHTNSIVLVSEYLRDWNTKNLSTEICLWLLTHPKFNTDRNWLQVTNEQELKQICNIFDNPCILLALLYEDSKSKRFIVSKIKEYIERQVNGIKEQPEVLPYLKKYAALADEISFILEPGAINKLENKPAQARPWRETFRELLRDENIVKQDFYETMQWASEMKPLEFVHEVLNVLNINSEKDTKCNDSVNADDADASNADDADASNADADPSAADAKMLQATLSKAILR